MGTTQTRRKKNANRKPKEARDNSSCQRFLDAAEYLFAEYGYEGAKIRAIADRSDVNLGALHHYWGSKEELFHAVCERRLQPMNAERMRRYDALEQTPPPGADAMRALFRASIEPSFFLDYPDREARKTLRKFYGRAVSEPSPVVGRVMRELFTPVTRRFFGLLRTLCPHLDDDEFYWRGNCILGAYLYLPAFSARMSHYAHPGFDTENVEEGIAQTVEFLTAGMLAPSLRESAQ